MSPCPSCGSSNAEGARFCASCGAALGPACAQCGAVPPAGARFCSSCGAALAAPTRGPEEERKHISVLFADLADFTSRSDNADPEDVRATLRPYHSRVKQEVEHFGGTLEKFVGDGVLAVFGVPAAHEDDPERAVRAALSLVEAVEDLNASHPGLELGVRVAVDTGEAVVTPAAESGDGEEMVTGDVVNTASRLQGIAPVGGAVVGEATFRATRDLIEYEPIEPVQVKGKAEPQPIWRAVGARARLGAGAPRPLAGPFVGREHDLRLLESALGRAVRERSVQAITITGEPGVGKTRLVAELGAIAEGRPELLWWRQGACLPYGAGITFWALGEIVKNQAGILETDSPEETDEKLATSVRSVVDDAAEREWLALQLAPLVGGSAGDPKGGSREESFTAWRRYLEAIAASAPLVLVLEDLHWADPAMLAFIEYLLEWSDDVPMLVIGTARPELFEDRPLWGGGRRNSATVTLSALTSDESGLLADALLADVELPAETRTLLVGQAGGNPLYLEEFARMVADRGAAELGDPEGADGIPIPDTVQALIAARLDALPPEHKALVHDAAVVGQVFWTGALAEMGGSDAAAVDGSLHELARRELVRPVRSSSVEGQAEYAFWHRLIQEVAYHEIPREARATRHRAAAGWIEQMAGEDHAEFIAHHYSQALELTRACGHEDQAQALEEPTSKFRMLAGDRALRLDVERADAFYRAALELLPAEHPRRAQVLAKDAAAAQDLGRFADAERQYVEAIDVMRAAGDHVAAAEVMGDLAGALWERGDTARATGLGHEALEILEQEPPGSTLARAYSRMAGSASMAGRPAECLEWSERALKLARESDADEVIAQARQRRGMARCELGDLEGMDDQRRALNESLELGLGPDTAERYINLGFWTGLVEGPGPGVELLETGMEFCERRGLATLGMWTRAETLKMLFDLGEWERLLAAAEELEQWDAEAGGSQVGTIARIYAAHVGSRRDEWPGARDELDDLLQLARPIADPQVLAPALAVGALAELASGQPAQAAELVEELETATEESPVWRLQHAPDAVRVSIAVGQADRAASLLEGLDPQYRRGRNALRAARAEVAEAGGEGEAAAALHGEAAEAWAADGAPLELGLSLLGEGRCRLALGDAREAGERFGRAREAFSRLGARPLAAEAAGWLERAAEQRPQ